MQLIGVPSSYTFLYIVHEADILDLTHTVEDRLPLKKEYTSLISILS